MNSIRQHRIHRAIYSYLGMMLALVWSLGLYPQAPSVDSGNSLEDNILSDFNNEDFKSAGISVYVVDTKTGEAIV